MKVKAVFADGLANDLVAVYIHLEVKNGNVSNVKLFYLKRNKIMESCKRTSFVAVLSRSEDWKMEKLNAGGCEYWNDGCSMLHFLQIVIARFLCEAML
jgi:hypothetical protein